MGAQARPSRGRRGRALLCALALGACVTLVGCDTGSTNAARSATPAATATDAPPPTPTQGGPPTPTITPLPGAGNLAGATDICTSPISVSTTLPPEIPPYTGQLRLAETSGSNAEFGYCTSDNVDTVANFYKAQLPGKGWQDIQTFTNNATRNLIATRGGENLTITVSPDVVETGSSDLLIILTGQ